MRYIHDQHYPTLLDHARGVVVINSTAGLGAIHQDVTTKVMGDAFYDFDGLTAQVALDDFWCETDKLKVNTELYDLFRAYLITNTQINDSFYIPSTRDFRSAKTFDTLRCSNHAPIGHKSIVCQYIEQQQAPH